MTSYEEELFGLVEEFIMFSRGGTGSEDPGEMELLDRARRAVELRGAANIRAVDPSIFASGSW